MSTEDRKRFFLWGGRNAAEALLGVHLGVVSELVSTQTSWFEEMPSTVIFCDVHEHVCRVVAGDRLAKAVEAVQRHDITRYAFNEPAFRRGQELGRSLSVSLRAGKQTIIPIPPDEDHAHFVKVQPYEWPALGENAEGAVELLERLDDGAELGRLLQDIVDELPRDGTPERHFCVPCDRRVHRVEDDLRAPLRELVPDFRDDLEGLLDAARLSR